MRYITSFLFLALLATTASTQQVQITDPIRFLALGDSYTFGESVPVADRWPDQLVDTLQERGYTLDELRVVAMTGWTTGQLLDALDTNPPSEDYSLVSLLIGVNNQYNGGSIVQYEQHFEELLVKAIQYAGGDPSRVMVLSIPDYRYTPFGKDLNGVSIEIDEFNSINEAITNDFGVTYVYITDITRMGLDQPELVSGDGLHPSPLMYALWVERILEHADLEITSVESIPGQSEIQLHPSPAQNAVSILYDGEMACALYSLDGKELASRQGMHEVVFEVGNLPPGLYSTIIRTSEGTVQRRFIKM